MQLGTMVTNPVTRHETVIASAMTTLDEISGGRAVLGLGRGDSSVRTIGSQPMRVQPFKESVNRISRLCRGETVNFGSEHLTLAHRPEDARAIPIYVAGYGPKVLQFAGEVADGVILQIATPSVIRWCLQHVREGAERAGRSMEDIEVVAATPCYVGDDMDYGLNLLRPFPPSVANHVKDVLSKVPREELPAELVEDMNLDEHEYDYRDHAKPGAEHSATASDEVVERMTLIGTPEACADRIQELADAGVTQICIYNLAEEFYWPDSITRSNIEHFGETIIPKIG